MIKAKIVKPLMKSCLLLSHQNWWRSQEMSGLLGFFCFHSWRRKHKKPLHLFQLDKWGSAQFIMIRSLVLFVLWYSHLLLNRYVLKPPDIHNDTNLATWFMRSWWLRSSSIQGYNLQISRRWSKSHAQDVQMPM